MNLAVETDKIQPGAVIAHSAILSDARPLGGIGTLTVRLAASPRDVEAAIDLRNDVFRPAGEASAFSDRDRFDDCCDHLLVFDEATPGLPAQKAVGAYRLMRGEAALTAGGFYSDSEFDVSALRRRHPGRRFLELGRCCVLPAYRSSRTMELLWQGVWAYSAMHRIDVMFGCASFAGTIPARHALALSWLHHYASAEGEWHVSARQERMIAMDLIPAEAISAKAAFLAMPPLIKGYLRLGARFGEGAVVDAAFGTTDVLVVLPVEMIARRYTDYFGETVSG